jgi:hypothetical protein
MTCEECRQQLLPFLYDLLEPLEREAAAAHLESCPECQQALKASRELLADAVKEEHAGVVFRAPTNLSPASTAPTLAMRPPRRRFFWFNRWAAAAAILLVLFGAGSVLGWSVWREQSDAFDATQQRLAKAKDELAKSQDALDKRKGQTLEEISAIQEQINTLFNAWKKEETRTRKDLEEKGAKLIIRGPQVPLPGANNVYEVELRQSSNIASNVGQDLFPIGKDLAKLQMRAFNSKTQETVRSQQIMLEANNQGRFILPADMQFKAGDDIAIEFLIEAANGKLITLNDNLKLALHEYVTHLATDRPLYRPGETVRFRSLTLERFSLKPAQPKFHLRYRILGPDNKELYNKEVASNILGPNNEPVKGPDGEELSCLGAGEFTLPANSVGGHYTLYVSEVNERFNEEKRTFLVHRWQAPRFHKELQFHRSSYSAGDQLKAQVRVVPLQEPAAGFRANIPISARITVDGVPLWSQDGATDNDGRWALECNLPNKIDMGTGTVVLECGEGALKDRLVRDIPLVVRDLQVEFYPEGGDLIAGAPNRVYFQARTPANRPANFEGRIVDEKNDAIAHVQTMSDDTELGINQGLGVFTFVPEAKRRYKLLVDSPIGIERTMPLPDAKEQGVVMTIPKGVVDNEIGVDLMSVRERRVLLVGAYCRGRMLDHKVVRAGANQPVSVILRPEPRVAGVYRVTVFEARRVEQEIQFRPLAERLIYRRNSEKVDVAIASDRAVYQPGGTVELSLKAKNEKKAFVPALAMMAVVDASLLKLAEEKTARSLPTHFFLTTEIRNPEDLENADVLLGDHPKAAASLDLLLGCQGWRRFAEQNPQMFQREAQQGNRQQQTKPPNFLANNEMVTQFLETEQKQVEKLDQTFVRQAIDMQKKLAEAEKEETGPAPMQNMVALNQITVQQVHHKVALAERRLRETRAFLIQFGLGGALLTLLFLGFYFISIGLRRLSDGGGNARTWLSAGLGLLGILFLISVVGTFAFMGENLIDDFRKEDPFQGARIGDGGMPAGPAVMEAAPIQVPEFEEPFDDDARVANQARGLKDQPPPENKLIGIGQQDKDQGGLEQFQPGLAAPIDAGNPRGELQQRVNDFQEDRLLRQQGNYQALLLKRLGRRVQLPPVHDPCVVREYAHQHKPQPDAQERDLSETVYWHPVVVMPDGKAHIKFDLPDSVTRFQVLVQSHTFDGRLGANHIEITSKLPFRVDSNVPKEVSDQDQVTIPVTIQNDQPRPGNAKLSARTKDSQVMANPDRTWNLADGQPKQEVFKVKPNSGDGNGLVRIIGKTTHSADAVERRFKVVQDGFPVTGSLSGVLEGGPIEHEINLPQAWVPGSLRVQAHFYPSPLAEIQGALEAMQEEPSRSFEQGLSSHYPNAMMLQFMKQQANQANPVFEKRARQSLQASYQKLADFECADPSGKNNSKGGYALFGNAAAPSEALTAYGLLQFREIAKVYPVDTDMLARTEQYLLGLRDGTGGFKQSAKPAADAYTAWSLAESGVADELDKELAALREQCKTRKDPYFLTLVGLSHLTQKPTQDGVALMQQVRKFQKEAGEKDAGVVAGAQASITGSQGRDLDVETTALAILGWLKADRPEFNANLQSAVKWLGQQRRSAGSYGGTQATALALKAMLAYQQKNPRAIQGGEASISVSQGQLWQGQANAFGPNQGGPAQDQAANRASFSSRSQDLLVVSLPNVNTLRPGKNVIQLDVSGNNTLPYTLTWAYRTQKPVNDPMAPVKLSTNLSRAQAKEGDTVKLTAIVENVSGKGQSMAIAVLGLPAGASVSEAPLAGLQTIGKISAWELRGREIVFYWRDLAPAARIQIELDLLCRSPGVYRGPASRAYVAYDADRKYWVHPLNIRIAETR